MLNQRPSHSPNELPQALNSGLVIEGFTAKNSDRFKEFFEHYKLLRIVEVGRPTPRSGTKRLDVPVKVELERNDERTREFTPFVRPVHTQPERWNICGGI